MLSRTKGDVLPGPLASGRIAIHQLRPHSQGLTQRQNTLLFRLDGGIEQQRRACVDMVYQFQLQQLVPAGCLGNDAGPSFSREARGRQ